MQERFLPPSLFPLTVMLSVLCLTTLALGIDEPNVDDALRQARDAVAKDDGLSSESRDAFDALLRALESERNATRSTGDRREAALRDLQARMDEEDARKARLREDDLLQRLDLYGDLRLRHESTFNQADRRDRHRQRVRFRIGANLELTPEWTLGTRIVTTNEGDPKSTHITLGDGFNSFDASFDRAFATYTPDWLPGFWATGGKFPHRFATNPIYGELVWDGDIQPEGFALGYTTTSDSFIESFSLVGGVYNVLERGSGSDSFAVVGQASARGRVNDNLSITGALGYYHFTTNSSDRPGRVLDNNFGNAVLDTDSDGTADQYASDFSILNPIISATYTGWEMPLTVSAEYIHNLRADIAGDSGWALGASLGKSRNKGDWQVYYQWQVVEQDAVFSPFSQDDFLLATNFRGHVFGASYRLEDSVQLHLWSLITQAEDDAPELALNDPSRDEWRIRLDLNFSF